MNMNEKKSAFISKIAEKGSAAQETEIAAMVNWGKASSRQEALEMIKALGYRSTAAAGNHTASRCRFRRHLERAGSLEVRQQSVGLVL